MGKPSEPTLRVIVKHILRPGQAYTATDMSAPLRRKDMRQELAFAVPKPCGSATPWERNS